MSPIFAALLLVASVTSTPESVVRDFYAAYAAGDAVAAAQFWTAAKAPSFQTRAARTFQTRCHVFHDLDVETLRADGELATVRVEARLTRWSALPGAPMETEHERATLTLRRERDGWKIDGRRTAEKELAERDDSEHCIPPELRNRRLVQALAQRTVMFSNRGERAAARRTLERARAVAAELDDPAAHSEVLAAESVLLRYPPHDDLPGSIAVATRAVELAEMSSDPDTLARSLMRLSRAHHEMMTGEDIPPAERALALRDHVEDAAIISHAASRLAHAHDNVFNFRLGLRYAKIAAQYAALSGDATATLNASLNLAGTFALRGVHDLALQHASAALELAQREGFPGAEATALRFVAEYELALGNHERVPALLDRALALHGSDGDLMQRAELLDRKFDYYMILGDLDAADATLRESAALRQCYDVDGFAGMHTGWLRLRQGRLDEALRVADRLDDPHLRGAILRAQGRVDEARLEYERAIDRFDHFRSRLEHPVHRTLNVPAHMFAELIELHVDSGEPEQALAVAQRIKARVLEELIAAQGEPVPEDVELERLNLRLVALNRRLLAIQRNGGDTADIRAELRRARGVLDEAIAAREITRVPPLEPRVLASSLLRAPDGVTVVEYVVGPQRTTAFVIRGKEVDAHTIEIADHELRTLVQELLGAIERRDARYRLLAKRLYDLLLRPLIGAAPRDRMLCIIPHDSLWVLPFQALVAPDGRHLIEHLPLFYAPSFAMLEHGPQSRDQPPTVLAFGDPALGFDTRREIRADHRDAALGPLPDAEREVAALRRFYGSRVEARTGAVAAEAALKREAAQYDVLHFATHGLLDDYAPMYSALLLAGSENEDGLLEAREIVSLPLQADLVVLSACNSARGATGSEGVLGLSWAFLATGCPRTVATQWRVGSASAARLMIGFHERLSKQRGVMKVAKALRGAQLEVMRDRHYRHPYYWAGFVLIGREQ